MNTPSKSGAAEAGSSTIDDKEPPENGAAPDKSPEENEQMARLTKLYMDVLRACNKSLIMVQDVLIPKSPGINSAEPMALNFTCIRRLICSGKIDKVEDLEEGFRLVFLSLIEQLPHGDPVHTEASLKLKVLEDIFKNYRETVLRINVTQIKVESDDDVVFIEERKAPNGGGIRRPFLHGRRRQPRPPSPDITAFISGGSLDATAGKKRKRRKKKTPLQPNLNEIQENLQISTSACEPEESSTSSSTSFSPDSSLETESTAVVTSYICEQVESSTSFSTDTSLEVGVMATSDNAVTPTIDVSRPRVKRSRCHFTSRHLSRRVEPDNSPCNS